MCINKVWAAYFSPTATTGTVVSAVAGRLADVLELPLETADFTLPGRREEALRFGAGDLVVFGVPVYAGRVPNILLPWLRTMTAQAGALAVPVVLYGNRDFDDALIELRDLLEASGMRTVGAAAFVGAHAFSRTLAAGRPDADDLAQAGTFADRVADRVRALRELPGEPVAVDGTPLPYGGYYQPRGRNGEVIDIRKAKPETARSCTRCGLCAAVCPMGSIVAEDVSSYRGICIKCGACIKRCPVGAKHITDEGYRYHKRDLEERLGGRHAPVKVFL